ncbi:MAG: cytochrome b/b6 domain-containing protein, partial [Alphaproteobacteria bacterium]|nr:cytochrome b/b6 domain-containing protein [Alphaproteobacteria bacterium]
MSSDETSAAPPPARPIKVWDLPVRLTHVAFIALVGASWYTGETMHVYTFGQQGLSQFDWHRYSGYAVLALVLFRILWGFFGSETARFSNFLKSPGTVKDYLRRLFSPSYRASLGHNPLGGWSVVLILALLLAQTVTGLMS